MKDSYAQAEDMAKIVEATLNNALTRKALKFCTAKCKCGRRVELALEKFAGKKVKMCIKCKTATTTINTVLNYLINKTQVERKYVLESIEQPYWRKGLATTLEGIAEFGVKKPFTGAGPFLVVWNITKACNLACIHCYEDAHIKAPDELTTKEAKKAIDTLAENGVAYIAVSGGEPMMRPDFFEIAEYMKEKGIALSIASNATLITPEKAKKLKEVNCLYAQVSLDGATSKTHDYFRGRESFNKTIAGIKNLIAEGIPVGISCTVTRLNINEFKKELELVEKLGVSIFMHYNFIPTGRGKEIVKLDITPQQREELLQYISGQNGKRKVAILSTAPQFARVCSGFGAASLTHFDVFSKTPEEAKQTQFLADFVGGCGAGRLYIGMEPNGDILPCVFIQKKLGNIKTTDFYKMWRTNKDLLEMRDREKFGGNCGHCDFRNSCGGCRARAYGYYGSLTAPDPGCIKNLSEWNKLTSENPGKSGKGKEKVKIMAAAIKKKK